MASLVRNPKTGVYRVAFRIRGKQYQRTLETKDPNEAQARLEKFVREIQPDLQGATADDQLTGAINRYLKLHLADHPRTTAETAERILARFKQWAQDQGYRLADITGKQIEDFYGYLISHEKLGPRAAQSNMSYVKACLRYGAKAGFRHGVTEWPVFKKPKPVIDVLTDKQLGAVLAAVRRHCPQFDPVIRFLAFSGWRVGDVLSLRLSDVDTFHRKAVIRQGKTGDMLGVHLSVDALAAIVDARSAGPWAFPGRDGNQIGYYTLQKALKRACKRGGMKERVHCHMLRHTAATKLARAGCPIKTIAAILGHSNPQTTLTYYVAYLDQDDEKWVGAMGVSTEPLAPVSTQAAER